MIGVIDVGGGLRGAYGAGVLDRCLHEGIHFHYGIGVSAGSANLANYFADQPGRCYSFYCDYAFRKQYMSVQNLIEKHSYIDMDYVYSTLSDEDGEYPLDYDTILKSRANLTVVATNALNGLPVYFSNEDMSRNHYDIFKASCSVPVINRAYEVNGIPCYDGGMSDPIPFEKAFDDGCDYVIVILTRPADYYRSPKKDHLIAEILRHEYPMAASAMTSRAEIYNRQLRAAHDLEEEGKLLIVAPDNIEGMSTLSKDRDAIRDLYAKGYEDGSRTIPFVQKIAANPQNGL